MASFNVSYEGRSTWLTYFSNLRGYVSAACEGGAAVPHPLFGWLQCGKRMPSADAAHH